MNINYNHIVDYLNNIYIDEDFIELRNYGIENNIPIMKLETKEFLKTLISISRRFLGFEVERKGLRNAVVSNFIIEVLFSMP